MMKEQLEAIRKGALESIRASKTGAELESLRVKYLGKKGELTAVLKQMHFSILSVLPLLTRMLRTRMDVLFCLNP